MHAFYVMVKNVAIGIEYYILTNILCIKERQPQRLGRRKIVRENVTILYLAKYILVNTLCPRNITI